MNEIDIWLGCNAPELYKDTSKPSVWNAVVKSLKNLLKDKSKNLQNIQFEEIKLPECKHKRCKIYCRLAKYVSWEIPQHVHELTSSLYTGPVKVDLLKEYTEHVDFHINLIAHRNNVTPEHVLRRLFEFMQLTPDDFDENTYLFWLSFSS